jgi:hypothetical protein
MLLHWELGMVLQIVRLSVHSFTSSTHVAPCHPVLHVQFPSTLLQSEVLAISHRQVWAQLVPQLLELIPSVTTWMAVMNVIVLLGTSNLQMEAVKVGCYYVCLFDGVLRHIQQYFSYIVAVRPFMLLHWELGMVLHIARLSVHSFTSSTHVAPCHPVLHVQFPSTLLQSEVLAISHRQVWAQLVPQLLEPHSEKKF